MMGDQAGPKGAGKAKKAMKKWRPVGESNPCFQRERLTS